MKKPLIVFGVSVVLIILVFVAFEPLEHQMHELLVSLTDHRLTYALASFSILSLDVVLPVPSSIVMYLNGGVLGVALGSGLSLLSAVLTSVIGFYLGSFFQKRGKAVPGNTETGQAETLLHRYGGLAILVSRGIPILSESIAITAGASGVSFRYYFLLNVLGYLPVVLTYGIFGSLGTSENSFLWSFACSILVSGLFWMLGRRKIEQLLPSSEVPRRPEPSKF